MSVTTRIAVPPEEFVLGRTLTRHPDLRVELERVVPFGRQRGFHLWTTRTDDGWLDGVSATEPDVDAVHVVERTGEGLLLRVEWDARENELVSALAAAEATCLRGVAAAETWHLTLRFPSSARLATYYRRCTDRGVDLWIKSVDSDESAADRHLSLQLTDQQHETLQAAFDGGYFAVPRKMTLQDLADRLGVSDTAASQRLRRGLTTLLVGTLPGARPEAARPASRTGHPSL
ncbi:MAG: helix-turn-helix domain-containing protein [Halorientalis sp.]